MKLSFPATERNREPIGRVLARILPPRGLVLEIASGSGQHAASFARTFPELVWQPTDPDRKARASIDAYVHEAGLPNLRHAVRLDVTEQPWPFQLADAVVAINMVHISPWNATEGLLEGAARILPLNGPLYLYGPYKVDGRATPESNQAFDRSLRDRDPSWGLRDVANVEAAAKRVGMILSEVIPMPANNLSLVFQRVPDFIAR